MDLETEVQTLVLNSVFSRKGVAKVTIVQGWSLTAGNTSAPTVICLVWSGSLRLTIVMDAPFFVNTIYLSITNHNLPFFIVSHISTRNLPMCQAKNINDLTI